MQTRVQHPCASPDEVKNVGPSDFCKKHLKTNEKGCHLRNCARKCFCCDMPAIFVVFHPHVRSEFLHACRVDTRARLGMGVRQTVALMEEKEVFKGARLILWRLKETTRHCRLCIDEWPTSSRIDTTLKSWSIYAPNFRLQHCPGVLHWQHLAMPRVDCHLIWPIRACHMAGWAWVSSVFAFLLTLC